MSAAALQLEVPPAPKTNKLSRIFTGVLFAIASSVSVLSLYPVLMLSTLVSMLIDNQRRRVVDRIVQLWARMSLMLIGASVSVEGIENLPPANEPVLYCPNHCSFLDIYTLSGYLPRRFKYVSKIEILRIPFIGWAMQFAKHIAIRRSDRASQLATFKEAVACLQAGSSIVTFPEGTRSKDGRMIEWKKGPFTMASRAKARVVPISIIGTHVFQPPTAVLPLAVPRGIRIVVHPPLDAPAAKQEEATLKACRASVLSALPSSMQPSDELS